MPRIRKAVPGDAAAIARVHVDSWSAAYLALVPASVLNQLSVETRAASWRRILAEARTRAWVALRDEAIAGFVSAGPTRDKDDDPRRVGEVYAIYLAPAAWGYGLGAELLETAEDAFARHGCRAVTIWVLAGNTRARRFYERSGYALDGGSAGERLGPVTLPTVRYRRAL